MCKAESAPTTSTAESERRVPRWPSDEAAGETVIGRLFAEWQEANRVADAAFERVEELKERLRRESPEVPRALLVRGTDWTTVELNSRGDEGPAGLRWHDPAKLPAKLRRLAEIRIEGREDEASIVRAKEIVTAARAYLAETEALRIAIGYDEANAEASRARAQERLLRWQIVAFPSRTFSDVLAKARIAESCLGGDVQAELDDHLQSGIPGAEAFQLSMLKDTLNFAR